MAWLTSPEAWIALATLTVLEIVLGIDNIIFISVLADRLPKEERGKARQLGLAAAMLTRILLLLSISWIIGLTAPLFAVLEHAVSGRDLVLIAGGLFLLTKSTREIHHSLEGGGGGSGPGSRPAPTSPLSQTLPTSCSHSSGRARWMRRRRARAPRQFFGARGGFWTPSREACRCGSRTETSTYC